MAAHTALRLVVRPRRGTALLDQLATAAAPKRIPTLSKLPPPCCCRRGARAHPLWAGTAHRRLFSTAPPPPRRPRPNLDEVNAGVREEPEVALSQDAPSETPSKPPEQPNDPRAEPEATSAPSPSQPTPRTPQPDQSSSAPEADPAAADAADRSLPSFTETHRHPLSARFSTFMDNLQSRALTATQTINDLTGYSAIEAIKQRNGQLERELAAAQQRLRAARHAYKSLTSHRASTQREVTTLLARKDTWQPADLERFTTLYRLDHELEAQVAGAAAELTEAEADEARLSGELNAGILKRYHEEQIWSDRIRRQSTWGTWGLMGVNVVLFLVLQFVAEPWRRKRLMRGIAEREQRVFDEVRRELEEVKTALEASGLRERNAAASAAATAPVEGDAGEASVTPQVDSDVDSPAAAAAAGGGGGPAATATAMPGVPAPVPTYAADLPGKTWKEILVEYWEDPELLREDLLDLYSDRKIDLRMRDVSLIALQGAAAGATVAVTVALALLRSSRT